jgi:ATP-binding cassette, subfamily B, bacterial PglK
LLNKYKISNRQAAEATKLQNILQELPRIFLEFLAIILFIIIIVFIFYFEKNKFTEALPIIGIYAAVSFKVLPSINRIMSAIQRLGFGRASLSALNKIIDNLRVQEKLINDNKEKSNQLTFKKSIVFENIFFKYENKKDFIVENLSFNIKKNSIILINGNSGKGKTTILNLIIGLLKPSSGKILIDHFELNELNNKSWLKNIGYVAQHTNLFDDTIKNNIILSLKKEFDEKKFQKAIDYSCLDNFVKNLNHGIETHIGERGLQISGGQKQRIGIARALYRNPEILILDEATNALDKKTEDEILGKLQELKKNTTILVVKHKNINESIFDDVINL